MKLVSTQLNPHFSLSDAISALFSIQFLFLPLPKNTQQIIAQHLHVDHIFFTNSARSALMILLKYLDLPKDKKIAAPAYLCSAAVLPFVAMGYEIEWINTDENGLINVNDLEQKLDNISAVLCPWIWGQKPDMQRIYAVCSEKNILVIEGCAHGFDTDFSSCDYKIFSFGREKIRSCVAGGALMSKDPINVIDVSNASALWQIRHALQPFILEISRMFWSRGGKVLAKICSLLKILPRAVYSTEKQGKIMIPVRQMGQVQQHILLRMIQKDRSDLIKSNAKYMQKPLNQLHVPHKVMQNMGLVIINHPQRKEIVADMKRNNIDIRGWDGSPLAPCGTNLEAFGYKKGQCKTAEKVAQELMILPIGRQTKRKDIDIMVKVLEKYYS